MHTKHNKPNQNARTGDIPTRQEDSKTAVATTQVEKNASLRHACVSKRHIAYSQIWPYAPESESESVYERHPPEKKDTGCKHGYRTERCGHSQSVSQTIRKEKKRHYVQGGEEKLVKMRK